MKTLGGRYYWIGNISTGNPNGNSPRYPLVIGQVDPKTMLLEKDTLATIDARGPGDTGSLTLSNFIAYQDRVTGEIVVNMTRMQSLTSGDSYLYRIAVDE